MSDKEILFNLLGKIGIKFTNSGAHSLEYRSDADDGEAGKGYLYATFDENDNLVQFCGWSG